MISNSQYTKKQKQSQKQKQKQEQKQKQNQTKPKEIAINVVHHKIKKDKNTSVTSSYIPNIMSSHQSCNLQVT